MGCTKCTKDQARNTQPLVINRKCWSVQPSEVNTSTSFRPPPHLCLDLMTAVKLGDLDTVRCLCMQGLVQANVTYRGSTPLGLAVARGDTAMVELLFWCGAFVNKTWKDQAGREEPPLVTAARLGHVHLVRTLVSMETIQLNATDSHGRTGQLLNPLSL